MRALPLLFLLILPSVASAQGTKADYERSQSVFQRFGGKVTRDRLDITWSADGKQLWYPESPVGKTKYVLVDVEKGTKETVAEDKLPKGGIKATPPKKKGRGGEDEPNPDGEREQEEVSPAAGVGVGERDLTPRPPLHEWRGGVQDRSGVGEMAIARQPHERNNIDARTLNTPSPFMERGPGGEVSKNAEREPVRFQQPRATGTPSPDGKWVAFVKDYNVWVRDAATKEETKLTDLGNVNYPFERFTWSPDSSKFIVRQMRKGTGRVVTMVDSSPKDQVQPKVVTMEYDKPGDDLRHPRLYLGDPVAKSCAVVRVEGLNPWSISDELWTADSKRFLYLYVQRGHERVVLWQVNPKTGIAEPLMDEKPQPFFDTAHKKYLRYLEATNEFLWMSERDGWNHLYLMDLTTGKVKKQITKGEWVVRRVIRTDTAKRELYLEILGYYPDQDPYHSHFARVTFDGKCTLLTDGDGTHTEPQYSPDGKHYLTTYSRVDLAPVTELRRTADGKKVLELERADVTALERAGWKPPERFVAKGRDGKTDIHGIIHRPTNFDPKKTYPVIEQIYAGPHGFHVPKAFRAVHGPQATAELGFVVVQIDGMGTSGRSKAFHNVCWKNLGDSGFPDRILWIKAAAKKHPEMDLGKGVGIYGGSAGGQSSTRAVFAHPDFYTVAVSDCGCHDNRMDKIWWNEQWMGWPVGRWYEEQSNTNPKMAAQFKGKLMLTVGELDKNVDPASTMQVANALINANKDFDLIVFPGRDHGAGGGPYGARRRADFFVRHLMGIEPRAK